MKNACNSLLATLICATLFVQNAQAQWSQNTSAVWTTNAAQKVGIGANNPTQAKLVVQGSVGSTTAMFGQNAQGISLMQNWPGVGFNAYYSAQGWRAMANGFGMAWNCDPNTGRAVLQLHGFTSAGQSPTLSIPLLIEANGATGIGTTKVATGYKLSVGGRIICEELKVQLQNAWPDYVFAANYKLKPLAEVQQHIIEKGHLPNIPSACEVAENGISVGEMQTKMMEKIEELTLYLLQQNQKTEALNLNLLDLKMENEALKERLQSLETAPK